MWVSFNSIGMKFIFDKRSKYFLVQLQQFYFLTVLGTKFVKIILSVMKSNNFVIGVSLRDSKIMNLEKTKETIPSFSGFDSLCWIFGWLVLHLGFVFYILRFFLMSSPTVLPTHCGVLQEKMSMEKPISQGKSELHSIFILRKRTRNLKSQNDY